MKGRSRKFTAAIAVAVLAIAAVPAVVVASIITNATAVGVNISAKLNTNTASQFTGTSGPLNGLTVTCTASTTGFVLSSKGTGLGPMTLNNPTFTGCKDSLGGTDTIKSNSTNGKWTTTYVNSPGSPTPNQIKIGIPKAGQTLVSSVAPNCTITVQPTAAGSVAGSYDNAGHLRLTGQSISYTAAGAVGACPTGTGSGTASFSTVLKSGGTGTPGYLVTPPVFGVH
jgi:hypothetical protein